MELETLLSLGIEIAEPLDAAHGKELFIATLSPRIFL